ncbi:MAG: hypothetical protein JWM68_4324, partial [Verrucomicrobiales bacterium]|nr:hypothetical protein [Verrucomicrobiales bacterium]
GNGVDPDSDGVVNLIEYAFGLNHNSVSSTNFPFPGSMTIGGQRYSTITFARAFNATDITFVVDVSSNLTSWLSGSSYSGSNSVPVTANTTEVGRATNLLEFITVRDNIPMNVAPQRFMRVRVSWP